MISFRPQKTAEVREQNKASCFADDLKLEEICRGWSKVTKDDPELLMAGIFAAFWRGLFETRGVPEVFQWVAPDDCLNSTNGVYEVTEDGSRRLTTRREKLPWSRRDLYRHRVVYGNEASEDEMSALGVRPMKSYPPDFLTIWLPELNIRRDDFARWYDASSLSAGTPLDAFWPGPACGVMASQPLKKRPMSKGERRRPQGDKIEEAFRRMVTQGTQAGDLLGMNPKEFMHALGSKVHGKIDPATWRRTFNKLKTGKR